MKHQQADKNIASWQSKANLYILLFVAGCASPSEVKVSNGASAPEINLETASFVPSVDTNADFGLYNGTAHLELGVKRDKALEVFPAPKESQRMNLLPHGFGPDFGTFGWETEEQAFGCLTLSVRDPDTKKILYRDLVVLALLTREDVSAGEVGETLSVYTEAYGEPTEKFPGDKVNYTFWGNAFRRLMISSTLDQAGNRSLTIAIGAPQVMSELGMSPKQASLDQKSALSRLSATDQK